MAHDPCSVRRVLGRCGCATACSEAVLRGRISRAVVRSSGWSAAAVRVQDHTQRGQGLQSAAVEGVHPALFRSDDSGRCKDPGAADRYPAIEDDPGDALITREAFAENTFGSTVHVVRNGEQTLDFVFPRGEYRDAPRPDLVLLDLNLPNTTAARSWPASEPTPIWRIWR